MENLTELLKDAPTFKQAREALKNKPLRIIKPYSKGRIIEYKDDYDIIEFTESWTDFGLFKTKEHKEVFQAVHASGSKFYHTIKEEAIKEERESKLEKVEEKKGKSKIKKAILLTLAGTAALTLSLGITAGQLKCTTENVVPATTSSIEDYVKELGGKFESFDLGMLSMDKVPVDYAKNLAGLFDAREISTLYRNNAPLEYVIPIAEKIRNKKSIELVGGKHEVAYLYDILELSLIKTPLEEVLELMDTFTLWDMWCMYVRNPGKQYHKIKSFMNLKDEKGRCRFDGQDIKELITGDVPLEYVKTLVSKKEDDKKLLTGFKIRRLYQFRYSKGDLEFKDTDKPNAVVVYPTSDRVRSFETSKELMMFKKIRENYDVRLVIACNEKEVYKAIDSTPDIELFIIGGHGLRESLLFYKDKDHPRYDYNNRVESEEYEIDLSDKELANHLKKLRPNAVIFLSSCSNGEGGKSSDNLANFVIKNAGNRKVIAAKDDFSASDIHIKSLYPLDIKIIREGKDITYTNK